MMVGAMLALPFAFTSCNDLSDATVTITAEGSDGKDYIYTNSGVTIEMGKFYQSKLVMKELTAPSISNPADYNTGTNPF